MILLAHIIIAIASLIYTAYVVFSPSKLKIRVAYVSLVLIFLSGALLIYTRPVHMAKVCAEGLLYMGVLLVAIQFAQKRLKKLDAEHTLV